MWDKKRPRNEMNAHETLAIIDKSFPTPAAKKIMKNIVKVRLSATANVLGRCEIPRLNIGLRFLLSKFL